MDGDIGGPSKEETLLDPGVGEPGASGSLAGPSAGLLLLIFLGVVVPDRGDISRALISLLEADEVPGEGGAAATAEGISNHSFLATVFIVKKNGHNSVSIRSDV